jgi:uncharacterized protein (DUF305 family)
MMRFEGFGKFTAGAVAVALALVVSGCTINIGRPVADSLPMPGHDHSSQGGNSSEFSDTDTMFAQMMIPHHQQAIDMGVLAPSRAQRAEVLELAAEISAEQLPEIAQMQSWLLAAGASESMGHDMGQHGMGMGGMLSDAEMTALAEATGADFDRKFLEAMIKHHEGAIAMAQMIVDSSNPEVKAFADSMVRSQTEQIEYMKALLQGN